MGGRGEVVLTSGTAISGYPYGGEEKEHQPLPLPIHKLI